MARVDERSPDRVAESLEEGESHPSTDEHGVGLVRERSHDSELVFDLGSADDDDERSRGCVEQPRQDLDLAGHQAAGRRRQVFGRPDDRGVCPVGHSEGVVHVGVLALYELEHELRVVPLLTRRETQVFEQVNSIDQLVEPRLHRAEAELGVGLPLRSPEMGASGDVGSSIAEPREGGQGRPHPEVVGDETLAVGGLADRDVEVDPDEDVLALEVPEILEKRDSPDHGSLVMRRRSAWRGRRGGSSSPTRCRTSRGPWRETSPRRCRWPS